jgi:fucose permease
VALLLQSANQWAVGGWLALYLPRKFGMTASSSILILALFWLGLTCGRVWATRLPPLQERMRNLVWATLAAVIGCVFLLKTVETSGTIAGALLLGTSIGLMHPLTLRLIGSRYPYYHPGVLNGFFSLSLMGGLLAPWLIAHLAQPLGIEIIIWLPLISSILVSMLLAAVFVESKLTAHSHYPA